MLVKGCTGLASGKFRDGDIIVNDNAWSTFDLKKPKERAFVAKWLGSRFVMALPGQDAELAEAGLEFKDGRVIDKRAPESKSAKK